MAWSAPGSTPPEATRSGGDRGRHESNASTAATRDFRYSAPISTNCCWTRLHGPVQTSGARRSCAGWTWRTTRWPTSNAISHVGPRASRAGSCSIAQAVRASSAKRIVASNRRIACTQWWGSGVGPAAGRFRTRRTHWSRRTKMAGPGRCRCRAQCATSERWSMGHRRESRAVGRSRMPIDARSQKRCSFQPCFTTRICSAPGPVTPRSTRRIRMPGVGSSW